MSSLYQGFVLCFKVLVQSPDLVDSPPLYRVVRSVLIVAHLLAHVISIEHPCSQALSVNSPK